MRSVRHTTNKQKDKDREHHKRTRATARDLSEDFSSEDKKNEEMPQDEESMSSSTSTHHTKGRGDKHKPRRIWQKQMDQLQTNTPIRHGGLKTPMARSKIEEAVNEEQGEDDFETRMG